MSAQEAIERGPDAHLENLNQLNQITAEQQSIRSKQQIGTNFGGQAFTHWGQQAIPYKEEDFCGSYMGYTTSSNTKPAMNYSVASLGLTSQ